VIVSLRRQALDVALRPPTTRKPFERGNLSQRELQEMLAKVVQDNCAPSLPGIDSLASTAKLHS
jgi:hypothetical protein